MAAPLSPRELADLYVQEMAPLYGIGLADNASLAIALAAEVRTPGALRYLEEKTNVVPGVATVSYAQMVNGLPVWEAGITVQMKTDSLEITGSHAALCDPIDVQLPVADWPYLPARMSNRVVADLLSLMPDEAPLVSATRLVVYQYEPDERFDPLSDSQRIESGFALAVPTLRLPPVPENIVARRHYVVVDTKFSLAPRGGRTLNWTALIEPQTGAVLYLRAHTACARAYVFARDPVTQTGVRHSGASSDTDLDPLRSDVLLAGLVPPTGVGPLQTMEGRFVRLVDRNLPTIPPPVEPPPHDFLYRARSSGFAAANAYVHCDGAFRLLESFGIDVFAYFGGTTFPVSVDHYAFGGVVNAQAPGNAAGNGSDGFDFGVAAAGQPTGISCDNRVVLHEFGHAILWDHVSSPNFGFCHSPGDSLAVILNAPDSRAPDPHESFPFVPIGRRHDRLTADGWAWGGLHDDRQYGSEQILSTTLFRVYMSAGGGSADVNVRRKASRYVAYLIVSACGTLTFTTRDPRIFASALMDADLGIVQFEGTAGGALHKVIRWSFEMQGLYQPPGALLPVTTRGTPPEVDLFVSGLRNGDYAPLKDVPPSSSGFWNRRAADGQTSHQSPLIGQQNYLYAMIENRGTLPPSAVAAHLFFSTSSNPTWPGDCTRIGGGPIPVPNVAPGAAVLVGPIAWQPNGAERILVITVDSPEDPSGTATVQASLPVIHLVYGDNNTGVRLLLP